MNISCYYHHRFQYLAPAFPQEWTVYSNYIHVDKTMLWDMPDTQVWWEYHDGILPSAGLESIERLELCYAARNKSKRFVYVKPNISLTQSIKFFEFSKCHNFEILTSPRWSYYHNVYEHINNVKDEIRLYRNNHKFDQTKVVFCGSSSGFNGHYDARKIYLEKAKNYWGDNFSVRSGLNPVQYVDVLKNSAYAMQPHGGGLRHATYECMALGVPNIIPDSSYIDDYTRNCNIVFSEFNNNIYDVTSHEYKILSQKCIDTWESHMTAQKIVSSVLDQL